MNFQKAKVINEEKVEIKAKKDKPILQDCAGESLTDSLTDYASWSDCACGQSE